MVNESTITTISSWNKTFFFFHCREKTSSESVSHTHIDSYNYINMSTIQLNIEQQSCQNPASIQLLQAFKQRNQRGFLNFLLNNPAGSIKSHGHTDIIIFSRLKCTMSKVVQIFVKLLFQTNYKFYGCIILIFYGVKAFIFFPGA